METNEVSHHQIRVFRALKGGQWFTASEIASATGVAGRTSRAHLRNLTSLGLLDVAEVFPAHRYRLSEKAEKRNAAYMRRLEEAAAVFGL